MRLTHRGLVNEYLRECGSSSTKVWIRKSLPSRHDGFLIASWIEPLQPAAFPDFNTLASLGLGALKAELHIAGGRDDPQVRSS